ncbi:hypothetical protein G6F32_016333 [Rhizopus arrhizus]|nr:hypothetical protein G6F32_016333 [Rhizopus arrhizus]
MAGRQPAGSAACWRWAPCPCGCGPSCWNAGIVRRARATSSPARNRRAAGFRWGRPIQVGGGPTGNTRKSACRRFRAHRSAVHTAGSIPRRESIPPGCPDARCAPAASPRCGPHSWKRS